MTLSPDVTSRASSTARGRAASTKTEGHQEAATEAAIEVEGTIPKASVWKLPKCPSTIKPPEWTSKCGAFMQWKIIQRGMKPDTCHSVAAP